MINKIKGFVSDVKQEMKKVAWPTRQELVGSAGVVIVSTALLAGFIGLVDFVLSKFINAFFKI